MSSERDEMKARIFEHLRKYPKLAGYDDEQLERLILDSQESGQIEDGTFMNQLLEGDE